MVLDTRTFDATNTTSNGAASVSGNDAILYSAGNSGTQAGSVFFNDAVSIDSDFSVSYTATIGGQDGLAFVFHNDPAGASALGQDGFSMGVTGKMSFNTGIKFGFAVEFDTHEDNPTNPGNDINDNHSVLRYSGTRGGNPEGNITTQVNVDSIVDLDDGSEHDVVVDWTAATNTLTWSLNGTQITTVSFTDADLNAFLSDPDDVYLGVTSSSDGTPGAVVQDFTVTGDFACFAVGTRIATEGASIAVQDLRIGDLILTAEDRQVRVKWIGRQTVSTRFAVAERLRMVRFAAGSLGDGLPHSELTVTADHAMLVDGILCNAGALVNDATIARVPLRDLGDTYTVYHVETEAHEIILANGAPAETFIDNVGRRVFDNFAEFEALYGDVPDMDELPLPRAMSARQLPRHIARKLGKVIAA